MSIFILLALSFVRQEMIFLNPLLDSSALYEDYLFNDTFDSSTVDDENYLYENSQTNSNNKSYTASYYEEQDSRSVDDVGTYNYEVNFNTMAFTDSTIAEDFYTTSTLSPDKTPTSTVIETSTTEGTDLS